MGPHPLAPLFNPRSIAVFGASASGKSVGSRVFENLVAGEFDGNIVPINPKYTEVFGRPCFSSIEHADEEIDLAVIATPADVVADIIADCGKANVRNAIILTAGFGETGEDGRLRQEKLLDVARRHSVRFLGPNCVGLVRPWQKMNASFLNENTPQGHLALISQSGALCSAISDWARPNHLGFSALVSLGNSANIDFGDVLSFLSIDPKTAAILLYVEGIMDEKSFMSSLREAARHKPVVVLKSGRHARSSAAASTHTGAIIGGDAVFDAALERAGAVRAMTFGQLFAAAEVLMANKPARGNRLCIITNGGGAGVLAADRAEDLGVELPPPSAETLDGLNVLLPAYWSKSNPVDILGDAPPAAFGEALKLCLADQSYDGALVMLTPQAMTRATDAARAVIDATDKTHRKPVLSCWMGETSVVEARKLLSSNGIPDFTTPERAVEAFSYLARHELNQRLALETPGPIVKSAASDISGAEMIIEAALATGRSMLTDIESKALLRAFHIPSVLTLKADSAAEALVAAESLGFPVAMKIASPQISHKSDVGGVRLNIMSAGDVRPAFQEVVDGVRALRPDADIEGVTIEAMAKVDTAREVLVGATRDPVFGPTIVFGAGGTMVEVLRDSAVSLPPLTTVLAERLIGRTRVSRLLKPFRNRPAVDKSAVIDVLMRVSEMVSELPHIEELDINPLLAGPDGALAVDARVKISRPAAGVPPYHHMAISPYPRHLIEHGYLADGTPITIRPIRPEDAESEQAFVRSLSSEARRFRFMQSIKELTPKMLVQFTQIDYRREMSLVAMTKENGRENQQGVARYIISPDNTSCEFAIVVGEAKRNQGIGSRMMNALISSARRHGLKTIAGEVLANNHAMLKLMQDLDFTVEPSADNAGVMHVERWL